MNRSTKSMLAAAGLVLGISMFMTAQVMAQAVKITNGPVIEKAESNAAIIAWSTSEPASTRVWYGTDKNNLTQLAEAPYGAKTHRVEIKNLQPNTTYYFQVESGQARGGSEAESQGVLSFKTVASGKPPVANEKPVLAEKGLANEENGKVKITSGPTVQKADANSAVVTWTTNVKGSSRVNYGTDPNNLTQLAEAPWGAGGLTHTVQINNLKPSTTYYFEVETGQAQGTGGAEAEGNKVMSFKTTATGAAPQAPQTAQAKATPAGQRVPLYRLSSANDRLYTTSQAEARKAETEGYHTEGTVGYVATSQMPGTEPLYRLVRQNRGHVEHFYTANTKEKNTTLSQGYREEGITGYVATSQQPGTVPLQRLEQPSTGEYLFTSSQPEARQAAARDKYQYQGTCCYVWQH